MPVKPSDVAEGIHYDKNKQIAIYNADKDSTVNLKPIFQRWAVVEVFFDPTILDQVKINQLVAKYGTIENINYAKQLELPRNTILATKVINYSEGIKSEAGKLMFLYPFFPSSLSLPCKPGEHVWVLFEHLTSFDNLGYWICGITGPGHIDDVNHTQFSRFSEQSIETGIIINSQDTISKHESVVTVKPRYHFKNGNFLIHDEGIYERILTESEASFASVYESVPRFKKRPGDIAFEGSNNTLIVLGRDRTGSAVTYTNFDNITDPNNPNNNGPKSVENNENADFKKRNAGSIDIVAGRGQTLTTGGKSIINDLFRPEIAKGRTDLQENEGNPDFKNDRSRIYVSQNTQIDNNLQINGYNTSNLKVEDSPEGDSGILVKSDKIRIFARSDVQILVSGFTTTTNETTTIRNEDLPDSLNFLSETEKSILTKTFTNTIKDQNEDETNWASITIKSNGDIVFKPSDKGFIRLGDDNADRALLCTDLPAVLLEKGVSPATPPLHNTMGGKIGGTGIPTQGTWASKVLVTGAK